MNLRKLVIIGTYEFDFMILHGTRIHSLTLVDVNKVHFKSLEYGLKRISLKNTPLSCEDLQSILKIDSLLKFKLDRCDLANQDQILTMILKTSHLRSINITNDKLNELLIYEALKGNSNLVEFKFKSREFWIECRKSAFKEKALKLIKCRSEAFELDFREIEKLEIEEV